MASPSRKVVRKEVLRRESGLEPGMSLDLLRQDLANRPHRSWFLDRTELHAVSGKACPMCSDLYE